MVNDKINEKGIEMELRELLRENDIATLSRTVVDEMEFPVFIVNCKGPFPTERRFPYNGLEYALSNYEQAEKYYNYLTLPLN